VIPFFYLFLLIRQAIIYKERLFDFTSLGGRIMTKTYNDFIIARCIELLSKDKEYQKINAEILEKEKELLNKVPKEYISLILKLDELKEKQTTESFVKIYLAAHSDKLS